MDGPELEPEILSYYETAWDEDARLRDGMGQLEFRRTQEIVRRHLPEGVHRILDVGGASGVHAEWMLDDGHDVHLIDPVPGHVEAARSHLGERDGFSAEVGDGRHLAVADGSFDAVLLFGPLYHLTERADRVQCWSEAHRVLRPGGVAMAAIISRFASLFSGLSSGDLFDPEFRAVVERDLIDGQHRNPGDKDWFTTAYFHHPDEVTQEAAKAGLEVEAVLGVEGIATWIPGIDLWWKDPERRQVVIDAARAIESEPTLLGLGPHVVAIARKPRSTGGTE
ncbi:MAG TPA: methyltransferase domain-containing protein [Acidimicrobiia bacterium]|nr:methyltransferase domain-containing protein [Acidimicrobiia bacterium]